VWPRYLKHSKLQEDSESGCGSIVCG
jgi:hypothetical protein